MGRKPETVLVLDVGKTNKKVAVYSRDFQVLAEDRLSLSTAEWNGLEVERPAEILGWMREKLAEFSPTFDLRAISVTAHGATLALLDDAGGLALPIVSYTSPAGSMVQDSFYAEFGDREELLRTTGSADIGFCNMAKVLYYVRTRLPDVWRQCRRGLFYAPYFSYALSGVRALEPTFVGNHSYLWDFACNDWSEVARKLDADRVFGGSMRDPWASLGPVRGEWVRDCGIRADCRVAAGIHDSNANLLPYLAREQSDFVLASTGTWCVLMRPATSTRLTEEQIAANVFFNLSARREPVLTGLLPAGMEYETFSAFSPQEDAQDEAALAQVVAERRVFVIPGTLPDVPLFVGANPGLIVDERAYELEPLRAGEAAEVIRKLGQHYFAALNLALAIATKRAMAHLAAPRGTTVYVEGGFADNGVYCRLLAALCPEYRWMLTRAKEGTSFGAALAGWACADGVAPEDLVSRYAIETTPIRPYELAGLDEYEETFRRTLKRA